jgi:CubicO group peptidase (beta-lactamase class C family)
MLRIAGAMLLMAVFLGSSSGLAQSEAGWPTRGWKRSTPEAQGVDVAPLAALDAEFEAGEHGYIDSMLVIRNGFIVYEKSYRNDYDKLFEGRDSKRWQYNYYDPEWHPYYQRGPLHTMQSVSKSVTSALIGIAIGRGEIPGVDTAVASWFDDYSPSATDPRWDAVTLRDLLTMTSGISWDEDSVPYTDPANSCAAMESSDDWIRYVMDQPMAEKPGSKFVYNSGVTMLLGHILWKATGLHAEDYAQQHLFPALGIESHYWKTTPSGHTDTEGGLYLEPTDLAKIGYLYLHDGIWEGKRLLPEGWVAASTRPHVSSGWNDFMYGFQWWLLPHEGDGPSYAWAAIGYGGQRLLVVPELDLIAVFTGWNIYDIPALAPELALSSILAAVP